MSNIEQQILNGQQLGGAATDEDAFERSRAAENGDLQEDGDSHADDGSDGMGHAVPPMPSTHDGPQTGAKGVIADYRHSRMQEQQRRSKELAAARAEHSAAAQRSINDIGDKTMWAKEDQEDEEDEDADLDDEAHFFDEYRRRRMAELSRAAERSGLGSLKEASPDEYVDIVEQRADSGSFVLALLVDDDVAASRRLESFIRQECGKYPQAVFLRVQAEECGFTDAEVLPILLVYRYGELKHNLVRVADSFSDPHNFDSRDVAKLLSGILEK
ncbi:thioredoxin-like protein [Martensiomyces pterosporus]|nr:thioredoxin-like protein [Martensiomyces pterosporus]